MSPFVESIYIQFRLLFIVCAVRWSALFIRFMSWMRQRNAMANTIYEHYECSLTSSESYFLNRTHQFIKKSTKNDQTTNESTKNEQNKRWSFFLFAAVCNNFDVHTHRKMKNTFYIQLRRKGLCATYECGKIADEEATTAAACSSSSGNNITSINNHKIMNKISKSEPDGDVRGERERAKRKT